MKFKPQRYALKDEPKKAFIDPYEIWETIRTTASDYQLVKEVVAKSLNKERLNLKETAVLINASDRQSVDLIKSGAQKLKETIYGNRIVLFAPLYIGNKCHNNCSYCGFRASNTEAKRKTLSKEELTQEVHALEDNGHKRLILVFGEHPDYTADFIAETVRVCYNIKKDNGIIRRVNINAAPLDTDGFETVKNAGIGTYQIFQETYHPDIYKQHHPSGQKADYEYRLSGLDRAFEAGIDDLGIGALFGLYDWRFEVLSLIRHVNHLEACYNIGPHTISFPRLKNALNTSFENKFQVSDEDFLKLICILRLAVPYTGMILTAREFPWLRKEALKYGVSQIDGGSKIELGGYSESFNLKQDLNREQFELGDSRSLADVIDELIETENIPSFCTACYRTGRTGEHFMEFSVPGFIKRFCSPNALLTFAEYLEDYARPMMRKRGWELIDKELENLNAPFSKNLLEKLQRVKRGDRDLFY